jgi:hypothetical protein
MMRTSSRRKCGFTLIETTISLTLVIMVLWSFTMSSFTASNSYREGQASETLSMQAHRTIEFITKELVAAQRGMIPDSDPLFGSSAVTYRQCVGANGLVLQWGPLRSIALQLEAGEVNDGLDNNQNGLIDEQALVWTESVGLPEQRQTLKAHWIREFLEGEIPNGADDNGNGLIDERGLTIETNGDVLDVQLTLESRNPQGRLITKTVRGSARVRN